MGAPTKTLMDRFKKTQVVPVVVIDDVVMAVPAAQALLRGGVDIMEITMRTAAGEDALHAVASECPEMLVGAGTVIALEQCKRCVAAGAKFIVSPGFDSEIVNYCKENGIFVLPGCVTPTEIMAGIKMGLSVFKFFPANVYGGIKGIKALAAPFGGIKFVPTGGISEENMTTFLSEDCVLAVGGSWLCSREDILAKRFDKIESLARKTKDRN